MLPERLLDSGMGQDILDGDALLAQRVCDLCIASEQHGGASKAHDPAAAFAVLDRNMHRGSVKGKVSARELKKMLTGVGR